MEVDKEYETDPERDTEDADMYALEDEEHAYMQSGSEFEQCC